VALLHMEYCNCRCTEGLPSQCTRLTESAGNLSTASQAPMLHGSQIFWPQTSRSYIAVVVVIHPAFALSMLRPHIGQLRTAVVMGAFLML
jgi:hypothetical protein